MTAQVITDRDRIRSLPERFARQYGDRYKSTVAGIPVQEVLAELRALDPETCTIADIAKVAPFLPGWVTQDCQSCHMRSDLIIEVGDLNSDDHEAASIKLCPRCLTEAADLVTTLAKNGGP